MRVGWGTHLSDSVVGLGYTFTEVCRLGGSAGPAGGGPALSDGEAIQGRRWRQYVVHSLCCGL